MDKQNQEVIKILKRVGAIITDDHFVYTSGKHGSVYIRKDKLYPYPKLTAQVCSLLARNVKHKNIDVVAGPVVGGVILSQWTAYFLSRLLKRDVLSVFTEKSYDDKQVFDRPHLLKRGYDALVKGKNVIVVEDITMTGSSIKKVVDRVREAGGNVREIQVIVNRNPQEVNGALFDTAFFPLAIYKAEAIDEDDCPLCKKGIPVNTEVGHGKEYLNSKKR